MKNKLNLIKKPIALLLCSLLLFVSCGDINDTPNEALIDPANLTSVNSLKLATIGMFKTITSATRRTNSFQNAFGGDDITSSAANNKLRFQTMDKRTFDNSNEDLIWQWGRPYSVIEATNFILENESNIETKSLDEKNQLNLFIGEAYFVRAYFYFELTNNFGKIPLVLSTQLDSKTPKSEIIDVYKQIESDLLKAESLLPNKHPDVSVGIKPNKGSAKAILAKLYMHWAGWPLKGGTDMYKKAATKAKEVINNAGTHGFALVSDMNTLWTEEESERLNSEIVWGAAHAQHVDNHFSNRVTGSVAFPTEAGGWNEIFSEIKYFEDFPAGPRKDATFITEIKIIREDKLLPDGTDRTTPLPLGTIVSWEDLDTGARPMFKKAIGQGDITLINPRNSNTRITSYFMRYSDLLLLYAEAEGRSGGNSPDAWRAINDVRDRAYGVGNHNDDRSAGLAETAFKERKWELGGEFKRWYDLVRMERVESILTANRSPRESIDKVISGWGDLSPNNYFVPIPQEEIDRAPHLAD
ncbi:SusD-like starch-binding protein associating with outer membrane [Lutibacter sp. Hel_I_33_5]|uniref:RagB/SusD family nutrient uptake outer membrane protein n=1 Tax=Lutibacter sp. Hel_I_33_5 TaxID=1566289 RepID=UPI00119E9C66|nr:RagB/SusD family nutrient uptake outer membrane protein [Lutibacter sp. Hel_I_33_5]TVZ55646.1 SusD-like starch-binding protein associating with outer membrane [Lutibacter sp. Hel_I_33_5]